MAQLLNWNPCCIAFARDTVRHSDRVCKWSLPLVVAVARITNWWRNLVESIADQKGESKFVGSGAPTFLVLQENWSCC